MPWDPYRNKRPHPCSKDCSGRQIACQDHCQRPEYLAWKAEQEKIREARRNYRSPVYVRQESVNRKR